MNELFIIFSSYILEFIFIPTFMFSFLGDISKQQVIKAFILLIPFTLLNTIVDTTIHSETNIIFLNILSLYIYILFLSKKDFLNSIFLTILIFSFTMIIQAMLVLFFEYIEYSSIIPLPIIGNFCTLIIAFIISFTGLPKRIYRFILQQNLPLIMAVINISAICLVLNIYNKIFSTNYFKLLSETIIPIILLVFVNIVMIITYINQQKSEKDIQIYSQYLPVIEEMIDQIRRRQHRFDNEFQTFRGLPQTYNNYESLCDAINSYSSYIEITQFDTTLLKLNLKFLAAFLFQKMSVARSSEKKVDLNIKSILLYSSTPEYIIIDAVGILFDNMLEATPINNSCSISIDCENNKIKITTINPGPILSQELRTLFFTKGFSTKSNSKHERGLGLYDLSEISKKYNGKIFLDNTTNNNTIQIVITLFI